MWMKNVCAQGLFFVQKEIYSIVVRSQPSIGIRSKKDKHKNSKLKAIILLTNGAYNFAAYFIVQCKRHPIGTNVYVRIFKDDRFNSQYFVFVSSFDNHINDRYWREKKNSILNFGYLFLRVHVKDMLQSRKISDLVGSWHFDYSNRYEI